MFRAAGRIARYKPVRHRTRGRKTPSLAPATLRLAQLNPWHAPVALENAPSGAHSQLMNDPILTKFVGFLAALGIAAMVAFTVGYVAHYDLGFSRLDIQTSAPIGAATIAPTVVLLLAIEYFEKLRKSK